MLPEGFEPTTPDSKSGVLTTTLWELLQLCDKKYSAIYTVDRDLSFSPLLFTPPLPSTEKTELFEIYLKNLLPSNLHDVLQLEVSSLPLKAIHGRNIQRKKRLY